MRGVAVHNQANGRRKSVSHDAYDAGVALAPPEAPKGKVANGGRRMSAVYNLYPQMAEEMAQEPSTPSDATQHSSAPPAESVSNDSFGAGPSTNPSFRPWDPRGLPRERFTGGGSAPGVVESYAKGGACRGPTLQDPVNQWWSCSNGAGTAPDTGMHFKAERDDAIARQARAIGRGQGPPVSSANTTMVPIIDDDMYQQYPRSRQVDMSGWTSKGDP